MNLPASKATNNYKYNFTPLVKGTKKGGSLPPKGVPSTKFRKP